MPCRSGPKLIAVFCCPVQFDDQGIVNSDSRTIAVPHDYANYIPTDIRGLTFARTPAQVIPTMMPMCVTACFCCLMHPVLLRAAMHWAFLASAVCTSCTKCCAIYACYMHSNVHNLELVPPLHLCCFHRLHLVSLQAYPVFVWTVQSDMLTLLSALWVSKVHCGF